MKRRILAALLALMICMMPGMVARAAEQAQLTLTADPAKGYGGDTVTLSVQLTAEDLGGLQATIQWNAGYMTYVEGSAAFTADFAQGAQMALVNDDLDNAIRIVYGNTSGHDAAGECILTAQFRMNAGVDGTTRFTLADVKLTDSAATPALLTVKKSGVSVSTASYDPGEATVRLGRSEQKPYIGDVVTVTMSVSADGGNIGSLQGTVCYDPSVLEYVADSAVFFDAASAAAFTKMVNGDSAGALKFVYGALNGCPEGQLLSLQFRVIGGQLEEQFIWLEDMKVSNAETDRLAMMDCSVYDTSITPQLRPEIMYYTLSQDQQSIAAGDEITLRLSAQGVEFGGLQAALNYNAQQLEYVSGSAAFAEDFAAGATVKLVNDAESGVIRLIYSNVDGYVPDGSDIFTAKFILRECVQVDPVTLTGIKTTTASADDLREMESVFVQSIHWPSVLAGHSLAVGEALYELQPGDATVSVPVEVLCGHDLAELLSCTVSDPECAVYGGLQQAEDGSLTMEFAAGSVGAAFVNVGADGEACRQCEFAIVVHSVSPLTLPADLTVIGDEAFMGVGAEEIVLPDGVTAIGDHAFAQSGEVELISLPDSVDSIADTAFDSCTALTLICGEGSAAHEYALANSIAYVLR